ncbi:carbohydrate ABC transporter permease [Paramicrobacterium fandaimingii]|uniref:carbohydrate ABC transporter permease n=1 Tax=Paramicrobacterium fandaimingii TaxID=2708079 RepID=UPI00142224A5|nr:carbohydrate ABC transporter permease [Microbacterium fandaimingii]
MTTQRANANLPRKRAAGRRKGTPGKVGRGALWALVLAGTLVPVIYLVVLSFTPQSQIATGSIVPNELTIENWSAMWDRMPVFLYALNSIVAAVLGCLLSLVIAVFVAFAIARFRTGGGFLPLYVLASFVAPPVVAIVPLFFLLRSLSLVNSSIGLALVYGLVNVAVAAALLEPFIERIPAELEEAAQIDGAGPLRTMFHVVLPLLVPGLIATGIIILILNYNELLFALTVLQSNESQTLPVAISLFQGDRGVQFGQMAAASMAAILPVYVAAVFMQRYLVGGLTSGAIK